MQKKLDTKRKPPLTTVQYQRRPHVTEFPYVPLLCAFLSAFIIFMLR